MIFFSLKKIARAIYAVVCVIALSSFYTVNVSADVISDIEFSVEQISKRADDIRKNYLGKSGFQGKYHVEERLIDGENFYRLKDYQRAAIIFMDIIESYPTHPSYPDALFYYADSLFLSRDYYGSRSWFEKFINEQQSSSADRFKTKVISRLVEIAIHLNDFTDIEKYFNMLGHSLDANAYYVKGKYYYFKGDMDAARDAFNMVSNNLELELKARYFAGVTLVKQERYEEALELYKSTLEKYKSSTIENITSSIQDVLDLINLGIGRLYFQKDFVENAAAAYQEVGRYSNYYDVALYEAAAVNMQAGNTILAERILEVLTLAMPDSPYVPKAKLLRGNLLLRAGRYQDAENVFDDTIEQFSPIQSSMDKMMDDTNDAGQFFNSLMDRSMNTLDISGMIPEEIVQWITEEPDVKRAYVVTQDLGAAKDNTQETERLLHLIEAVVSGSSPVHAVPMLRNAKRQALQMRNQLADLKNTLMVEIEKKAQEGDQKINELKKRRLEISGEISKLPSDEPSFKKMERESQAVYVSMRKELARQEVLLDRLDAMVVGLTRYIDKPEYSQELSADIMESYQGELERTKAGIVAKREEVEQLKNDVEEAKVQLGFGDDEVGEKALIEKQDALLSEYKQYSLGSLGVWGQKVARVEKTMDNTLLQVKELCTSIDLDASKKVSQIKEILVSERDHLLEYKTELMALNEEAEVVVTGVTKENFSTIRKDFHDLILKADLGIIDIAWLRKEEHKNRSILLNKERTQEIQNLNDEFSDVVNSAKGAAAGK
ncbi:MAG: tetratricopeptide repeat protein [Deltaproteobacteria bacterium]|nr:tetratricopeptide repeat protein [Deltaproteobacteria bacterium]